MQPVMKIDKKAVKNLIFEVFVMKAGSLKLIKKLTESVRHDVKGQMFLMS